MLVWALRLGAQALLPVAVVFLVCGLVDSLIAALGGTARAHPRDSVALNCPRGRFGVAGLHRPDRGTS